VVTFVVTETPSPDADLLADAQLSALSASQLQLGPYGRLRPDDAGSGLVVGLGLLVNGEHRQPPAQLDVVEVFVLDPEPVRERPGLLEERAAGARQDHTAALGQQPRAGLVLELSPQLM
jgi:hypothetical protein